MEEEKADKKSENPFISKPAGDDNDAGGNDRRIMDGPKIPLPELFSLVRHSKISLIKDALDYLPNKKFDKSLIQVRICICLIICLFTMGSNYVYLYI